MFPPPLSSRRVKFESVTALFRMKVELAFWMNKIQDRTKSLETKFVVQSVLLCLSYLFMYILTSKFIKKNRKKLSKQKKKKNEKLEFC